jgi:hypothetical protein
MTVDEFIYLLLLNFPETFSDSIQLKNTIRIINLMTDGDFYRFLKTQKKRSENERKDEKRN